MSRRLAILDNKKELRVSPGLMNGDRIMGSPFCRPLEFLLSRRSRPVLAQKVANAVGNREVLGAAMVMRAYMQNWMWEPLDEGAQ